MTSSKKTTLAVCTFLLATLPGVASAQRSATDLESARQLYNQGIELRDKGDQKGALEKFKAAHALGNTPLTGIELCRTHAALNQPVEAREICLSVARIPPMSQETPRSQEARNEAARVAEEQRPKIGQLKLKVRGVPEKREATVTVDGASVPAAALNEPRAVNPGIHVITARVGTGPETRGTLETREGEVREVELVVQPPPPGSEPPPPAGGQQPYKEPTEKKKSNTLATVAFATAGVSAGIGLLFGIDALVQKGKLDDSCRQKSCAREDWDRLDDAKSSGTAATVFFVISGVALGAVLVSTLSSSKSTASTTPSTQPKVTPVIGLGGAGIHGTF